MRGPSAEEQVRKVVQPLGEDEAAKRLTSRSQMGNPDEPLVVCFVIEIGVVEAGEELRNPYMHRCPPGVARTPEVSRQSARSGNPS
jgi:hypothetical protein